MAGPAFTVNPSTDIGWVRLMTGNADPKASDARTDARIQEYLTAAGTKYDAAMMLINAMIADYGQRVSTLQIAPSPDIVKIADAQARFDNLQRVRSNLLATRPAEATSTSLPVRRVGSLGAHPSDPRNLS